MRVSLAMLLYPNAILRIILCLAGAGAVPVLGVTQQWLEYSGDAGPGVGLNVVLVSGDEEYRSEEMMPALARILSKRHGFDTTVLFAQDPANPGVINPAYYHNIPGLEKLSQADLAVFFIRFRDLPDEQMEEIESYLRSGRPLIGVRTANHGFRIKKHLKWKHWDWKHDGSLDPTWKGGFGLTILGTVFTGHHGHHKRESTRGVVVPSASSHPILNGIQTGSVWGPTDVYGTPLPLLGDAKPLLLGQVLEGMSPDSPPAEPPHERWPRYLSEDGDKNDPMMPIALIRSYQIADGNKGKAFCSTMGSSQDFANEGFRHLLANAALFLTGLPVPEKGANVALVGAYTPTRYETHRSISYWEEKSLNISSLPQDLE